MQESLISRTHPTEYEELFHIINSPDPSGAVILGGLGIGKTTLVEAVLAASGRSEPVMRLYCAPSLSNVPHGVLSPYLGGLESIEDAVTVLRELNTTLLAPIPHQGARIIVVEDAQYLDAQSCFVLSLLVENDVVKVIAVGTGTLAEGSPLSTLCELPAFVRIHLQPLDLAGIKEAAQAVAGRKLSEGTIRIIERVSSGNPRVVEAYVASCIDQGILYQDETLLQEPAVHEPVWIIAQALPEIDARLRALGREFLRLVSDEEQRTLQLLALAGPQCKAVLDECSLPYRRLVDSDDLEVRGEKVLVRSKLLQRIFRALASVQQNAELQELWAAAISSLAMQPTAREILWCLDLGVDVPSEQILRRATQAAEELNFHVALRLCLLGQLSQHHEEGALLEAKVLLAMGHHYAARAHLLRIIEHLTDLDLLGQAYALLLEVTSCIEIDGQELESILDRWEAAVAHHGDKVAVGRFLALHADASRTLSFWLNVNSPFGQSPSVQEMRDFLESPDLNIQARIIGAMTLSDLYSATGSCHDALDLLKPTLQLLKEETVFGSLYEVRVFFRIGWNLLFAGEYDRAQELIEQYRGTRLWIIDQYRGAISLLEGIKDLLQGRVRQALEKIAEAVTELRTLDTTQVLALACNLYRMLLCNLALPQPVALQRDLEEERINGAPLTTGQLREKSSEYRILARGFAAGIGSAYPGERLRDFPLIEREFLFNKTRQLPDEKLLHGREAEQLRTLAAQQQGSRAQLLLLLINLRASGDTEALEKLSVEALQKSEYLVAVESLARAAERHVAAGDQRSCGALLRRAASLIELHDMDPGKYLTRVLAMTALTAREAEIVDLAREGLNNAQIARSLVLSQRTVEGHIYRVFSKLGINERSELKRIRT